MELMFGIWVLRLKINGLGYRVLGAGSNIESVAWGARVACSLVILSAVEGLILVYVLAFQTILV